VRDEAPNLVSLDVLIFVGTKEVLGELLSAAAL
jgi:hypothetical protein